MTWYIVDGMDGVGKSSVARHIKGVREREGRRVAVFTHPCRGTRIGRLEAKFLTIPGKPAKILSIIFYVLDVLRSVSYMNRRRKDYDDIIFVRYIMEVAYLGDRSMPLAYRFFEHFFPPMEVPILVDLDPDEAFRRIGSRGEELEVYETPEKLREIGGRMRRLAEEHGWYVVDNGGSEEETHGIIRDILDSSEKHRILLHPPQIVQISPHYRNKDAKIVICKTNQGSVEKLPKEFTSWLPSGQLLSLSTFIVCVPAAFTQVISFNLMFDLNAFPSLLYTWTFPAFVGGECASMALCACMIDRYGRRRPYLIGSLLFLFGTAACALSTDMVPFIFMRGIQGFGAGFIIISCIAQIYFDIKTPKLRYAANGIMSLGFGVGMLTGIFAGKLAVETIGWANAFWIIFLAQAVVTYPCWRLLSKGENSTMKADFPGAIVLSIWVLALVLFLQKLMNDWTVTEPASLGGIAVIIALLVLFFVVEVVNPHSVLHRKVHKGNLMAASMIFIVILGVIDMAAVGCMVKIALFTYRMSVLEAAPYFTVLVLGAAITAITLSKKIDKTGHLPWLLLSAVLSPVALLSMLLVRYDDPSYMFAVHLFLLGLANGCLISMLNATIQNRTNKDNNGAYISFAIMYRTAALWLGYNFYTYITNIYMTKEIGGTVSFWNSVLPVELPMDSNIANYTVTPMKYVLETLPGLDMDISTIFADGAAVALVVGAAIFTLIAIPVAVFMVGREKHV